MATLKAFLDARRPRQKKLYPVKISVSAGRAVVFQITTKILISPENWDAAPCRVIKHPQKGVFNMALQEQMLGIQKKLLTIELSDEIETMTVKEIRKYLASGINIPSKNDFFTCYREYIDSIKNDSTREMHELTFKKIRQYDPKIKTFKEINKAWILDFEKHLFNQHLNARGKIIRGMAQLTPNGVNLHMRNLRAAYNHAIDIGRADANWYPFKNYTLPYEEPAKLALPVNDLRTIRDYPAETFCQRYLLQFMEERNDYDSFLRLMNKRLKEFGPVKIDRKHGGKKTKMGLYPFLRSYYARDTWATLASLLDVPEDTIAAALGHGSKKNVTRGYISFNMRKVDIANRMVLDFVASQMTEDQILDIKAARMHKTLSFIEQYG